MKNEKTLLQQRKGTIIGLVLCLVASIAVLGTHFAREYKGTVEKKMEQKTEESQAVNESTVRNPQKEKEIVEKKPEKIQQVEQSSSVKKPKEKTFHFTEEDMILWPLNGDVIISYSMDKTVYFATLDQYKYNPAMIISGAEGEPVLCAAKGVVKSIEQTAQTGTTLTVDMGNGYEAVYGQLKDVPLKTGDYVECKTILGYINKPTKYYSVEGCNLYFSMKKDGQPVNPLEYLE